MDDLIAVPLLILSATLRVATPLILCAMGGLFSERAGIIDIGLEGKMLASAFAAAATAAVTGSAWAGLAAGIAAAVVVGLVHGFACITHHGNQVVSGMALNITISGLTVVLGYAWFHEGGQTPLLGPGARFAPIELPGVSALGAIPGLGLIYREVLSGHNLLVYIAAVAVPAVAWIVYRTRFGLRLRAVGEHPRAAETVGIAVRRTRYWAVLASGVLAALGGAYLSLSVAHSFTDGMTGGRGFIGLAAMIFGRWTPVGALVASLIFGYGTALSFSLQGASIGDVRVPVQLLSTLPYILTILAVAGFVGRSRPPAADGIPYETEGHA